MRLLVFFLLLAALPACSAVRPATPAEGLPGVQANARKWAAANVRNYTFTYERQCFCTAETRGPFVVTVANGQVASVRRLAGGMTPDGQPMAGPEDTRPENRLRIEDFFDLITGAHRDGVAEVRTAYDARLGFPTSIWIDRDEGIADEEIGYQISNLRRN